MLTENCQRVKEYEDRHVLIPSYGEYMTNIINLGTSNQVINSLKLQLKTCEAILKECKKEIKSSEMFNKIDMMLEMIND